MTTVKKIIENARAAGVKLPLPGHKRRVRPAGSPAATATQVFRSAPIQSGSQAGTYTLAPVIPSLASDILQQNGWHDVNDGRLSRARKNMAAAGVDPRQIHTGKILLALHHSDHAHTCKRELIYIAQHDYVPESPTGLFQTALAERHAYHLYERMGLLPGQLRVSVVVTPPAHEATGKVDWIEENGQMLVSDTVFKRDIKIRDILGQNSMRVFLALRQNWDVLFDQTGLGSAVNRLQQAASSPAPQVDLMEAIRASCGDTRKSSQPVP